MNLENLVTSLELSKKLKEAGVPQRSVFYWTDCDIKRKDLCEHYGEWNICLFSDRRCKEYSAYLAEELGLWLPKGFYISKTTNDQYLIGHDFFARLLTEHDDRWERVKYEQVFPTEAEARGEMLFWLIEKGYIKVEELK